MGKRFRFDNITLNFDTAPLEEGLEQLSKETPEMFQKGLRDAGVWFLTGASTGNDDTGNQARPPIRYGVLRGSGAVYIGGKLVSEYKQQQPLEADAPEGTVHVTNPNQISAPDNEVTWSWNTSYAAAQHEGGFKPGPATEGDPNAGPKWLEKHLATDAGTFWKTIAVRTKYHLNRWRKKHLPMVQG